MKLKKNLNRSGRIARLIFALVLFTASIYYHSLTLLFVGAFVLFEVLFSFCLFYHLMGINKCPIDKK